VKKIILLLVLIFIVFVAYNRQRLYLRDPLANVTHDGVKEDGTQVFINYSNDVLLENDNPPLYVKIIQHNNHVGLPVNLKCMHFIACLADADVVTLVEPDTKAVVESMTGKSITLREGKQETVITLR